MSKRKKKIISHKDIVVILSIFFSIFVANIFNRVTTPSCSVENMKIQEQEKQIETQKIQYNQLFSNQEKSQALITATTNEVKRLSNLLKQYTGENKQLITIMDSPEQKEYILNLVQGYIKKNESFSDISYCDANGTYHNGYGTKSKYVYYKPGTKIVLRDCHNKLVTITATNENKYLPEIRISKEEALERKKQFISKNVLPYIQGVTFRSEEEIIAVVDTLYNRGITQSKDLFTVKKTINCKALYSFMTHSNKNYQRAMRERYAKNYVTCIQS